MRSRSFVLLCALGASPSLAQEITKPPVAVGGEDAAVLSAIRALSADEEEVRYQAALSFVNRPDPRAFDALRRVSHHRNESSAKVREAAIRALGELGMKEAYDPLMTAIKEDKADAVKWVAVIALGKIGEPRAFDQLKGWAESQDAVMRPLAVYALGFVKDRRALDLVAAALGNSDRNTRNEAGRALEIRADPAGCDILLGRLPAETTGMVMATMVHALGRLGCKDAPPVFERLKKKLDTEKGEFRNLHLKMDDATAMITGKRPEG